MVVVLVKDGRKELSKNLEKIAMCIYHKKDKLANMLLKKNISLYKNIQVKQGKFDLQEWMELLMEGSESRYRRADRALTAAVILSQS
ncbi:MAG: hypothetical protein ABIJ43_04445 [Candidatus Beckwithbacteria bacterium]